MKNWFRQIFKSPASDRDKFIARLFGIFNEEIVRIWCKAPWSPYCDLGRPRVVTPSGGKGHTLDFTLQSKKDGSIFVAEMKCWVEYQNYRFLTLSNDTKLDELESPAFCAFLDAAKNPSRCKVSVNGSPKPISGAILIWGDVAESGRNEMKRTHGIADVLSLKEIIEGLVSNGDNQYRKFLEERREWCQYLLQGISKD